ncbi:hypothetical protein FBQ97_10815 [Acidobacteria bacterium ACD]|nr:MAG: hypothetical protein EDX89_02460 [Acidobacteriota bacterium]MCE7958681.1 hypothetical protein [Acidobacteria bacterium ACB2]MDL1950290.1 hypothetical protein [Acidobacteria bacterium ACD]
MPIHLTRLNLDGTCSPKPLLGGSSLPDDVKASVGLGGVNRWEDVLTVQRLLNGTPPEQGGPVPKLPEDGIVSQRLILAIAAFQRKQVGWSDGRVDPGGETIRRLQAINEMPAGKPSLAPLAVESIPAALAMIFLARAHLMNARFAFAGGGGLFASVYASAAALVNKHFHLDRAVSPLSALDMVDGIFSKMQLAIGHVPAGTWVFEDDPSQPPDVAYAFTYWGGYLFMTGKSERRREGLFWLDRIYLCRRLVSYDRDTIVYAMIHELAHFVGGALGTSDEVDDWAYAHRPTGYETLAPYRAVRNADCYSQYAWEVSRHVAYRHDAHRV